MAEHPAVAYLRNAHDQAERWATAASDGEGWWLINPRFADHRTIAEFTIEGERGPVVHIEVQEHDVEAHQAEVLLIQSNHPAAVMRRVKAERTILDEHSNVNDGDCGTCVDGRWGYPTHGGSSPQRWPCRTLLALAAGWGWTEAP